ncbi:MAG: hypothetical protein NUW23_02485, partial [Firmicutes bacterium]|nr:hypothetical protein [Bacillota bacterium]
MTPERVRQRIETLWTGTKRAGIGKLITYLRTSDFYEAPCSTKHHLARPGGLAEHSLNVYRILKAK